MTRARETCEAGVYHVTTHAINENALFLTDDDYKVYLTILRHRRDHYKIEVFAWCLMPNHVHLLVKTPTQQSLADFMRDVNSGYAKHYNKIYLRGGTLIHDRYYSKPIDSDEYLLTVVRYIHHNPLKAQLTQSCDYRWSSYQEYIGNFPPYLTSTEFVLQVSGGLDSFKHFHELESEPEGALDPYKPKHTYTYDEAAELARNLLGEETLSAMKRMSREERGKCIAILRQAGLSCRQISSLTGIPVATISRCKSW